jgi:hypothetical protein
MQQRVQMSEAALRDVSAPSATVMYFDVGNLKQSMADPALAALLRQGWTVITQFAVDTGEEGGEKIAMVLAPPAVDPNIIALAEMIEVTLRELSVMGHAVQSSVLWLRERVVWVAVAWAIPVACVAALLWRLW